MRVPALETLSQRRKDNALAVLIHLGYLLELNTFSSAGVLEHIVQI